MPIQCMIKELDVIEIRILMLEKRLHRSKGCISVARLFTMLLVKEGVEGCMIGFDLRF